MMEGWGWLEPSWQGIRMMMILLLLMLVVLLDGQVEQGPSQGFLRIDLKHQQFSRQGAIRGGHHFQVLKIGRRRRRRGCGGIALPA